MNTGVHAYYFVMKSKNHFKFTHICVFSITSGLIFPITKMQKKPEKELS